MDMCIVVGLGPTDRSVGRVIGGRKVALKFIGHKNVISRPPALILGAR